MRYLKTFAISAPALALLYHFAAALPWWPDTLIMGAATGALACVIVFQFTVARRAGRHLRNAVSGTWRLLFRRTTR